MKGITEMKIIEKFVLGKNGNRIDCEDDIFINKFIAAVIDGATSKTDQEWNNKTPGNIATEITKNTLENVRPEFECKEVIKQINNKIFEFYERYNLVEKMENEPSHRLSASMALFNDVRKEVWIIGDCQSIIDGDRSKNVKKIDKLLSEIRSLYIKIMIKKGHSTNEIMKKDFGREYIYELLKNQYLFQNSKEEEYGYGVIDGFQTDISKIKIVSITTKIQQIVLATDGYPQIFGTLDETEKYLEDVLNKDPLMINMHKSTKGLRNGNISFDDRAYIRIVLFA